MEARPRYYPIRDSGPRNYPDHARTVRVLSDADLEDEILSGRGEPAYRVALIQEADERAKRLPEPEGRE